MNNSIGAIIINKDFAKGQLLVNGKKTPLYFHFYKEQRKWKLDITALFPVSNMSLQQMIKESGKSENEYILLLLQTLTGKKLGHEIWEPLAPVGVPLSIKKNPTKKAPVWSSTNGSKLPSFN